jgi:hypothetical protein
VVGVWTASAPAGGLEPVRGLEAVERRPQARGRSYDAHIAFASPVHVRRVSCCTCVPYTGGVSPAAGFRERSETLFTEFSFIKAKAKDRASANRPDLYLG